MLNSAELIQYKAFVGMYHVYLGTIATYMKYKFTS